MDTLNPTESTPSSRTFLGHPLGLFLLFFVEMWERFSYYGMRGFLVLYLVHKTTEQHPGRGWSKEDADGLYGYYTGLAYLLPIFGGLIADKLIGAHRSLLVGSILIALGHAALAVSGIGGLDSAHLGMSIFIMGLALIVIGTGHFKPNVSVMVGQLYAPDDPRRDGAFTIFYMGINLGAFIGPLICGLLGEKLGWHWGFGAAAVGMLLGLIVYIMARPALLNDVGLPPPSTANYTPFFIITGIVLAAGFALLFHFRVLHLMGLELDRIGAVLLSSIIGLILLMGAFWLIMIQAPSDRGPTVCLLIFVIFNAVFWFAYEQAGSSLNHFADEMTRRKFGNWEMPASWFQSVNALAVIILAPIFAWVWSSLDRRHRNPSQPIKLGLGLILLGAGYVFMVLGSLGTTPQHRASGFWLSITYVMAAVAELFMSPTGLSFLTRVAPVKSVSLLMGIWFLSNAFANKVGGHFAGQIEKIEKGTIALPWYRWFKLGGQADFFLFFVLTSIGAGVLILLITPVLKRLLHGRG